MPWSLSLKTWLCAAAALALLSAFGWYTHAQRDIGRAEVQQKWDAAVSRDRQEALQLAQANAKETQRRLDRQEEAQHAHDQELARARADAALADAAAGRLSSQLAAFVASARGAASHPATAGDSPPAGDPISVLANVLGRADERAGILADYADRARAAGIQCQASYDALTH